MHPPGHPLGMHASLVNLLLARPSPSRGARDGPHCGPHCGTHHTPPHHGPHHGPPIMALSSWPSVHHRLVSIRLL